MSYADYLQRFWVLPFRGNDSDSHITRKKGTLETAGRRGALVTVNFCFVQAGSSWGIAKMSHCTAIYSHVLSNYGQSGGFDLSIVRRWDVL